MNYPLVSVIIPVYQAEMSGKCQEVGLPGIGNYFSE